MAPPVVALSTPFELHATLDCPGALQIDGIEVEVTGTAFVTGSGDRSPLTDHVFARRLARLPGRRELIAGRHVVPTRFCLPAGVPGNFRGATIATQWSVRVRVGLPGRIDPRPSFPLHVVGAGFVPPLAPNLLYFSSRYGPLGDKPYAELALASPDIQPGSWIEARVALANTARVRYSALRLTLVAEETQPSGIAELTAERLVHHWRIPLSRIGENEPIPIAIRVPDRVTPGFRTGGFGLSWTLALHVEVPQGLTLVARIPLRVTVGCSSGTVARPVAVGNERIETAWRAAAAQTGWTYVDGQLEKQSHGFAAHIQRTTLGRKGHGLVAYARTRDLGIGLHVRQGRLRARDAAQSEVLARSTDAAAAACPLVDVDDTHLRCEDPFARSGAHRELDAVIDLARSFDALLHSLASAHASLPVPADLVHLVGDYREAARRLGAELDLPSLGIHGRRDEIVFGFVTRGQPDRPPTHIDVWVDPLLPLDGRLRGAWAGPDELLRLPKLLAPLARGALAVVTAADRVCVKLPAEPADLEAAIARTEEAIALAARLSLRSGIYR